MSYRAPEFLSLGVEENECGGILEAVKWSQYAPGFALDIHPDNNQAAFVLLFDPIHDGFHRCTGNSIWRLELEQDGRTLPDARLDLGSIIRLSSLARVEKDPRRHQSEHQHAKG